jgi:protein O-GlcNAc transferase
MEMEQGRLEEAEWQLRAAVALSPLIPSCHNKLGKLYLKERRLDDASTQFQQSVDAAPNFRGYDGLGDISLMERDSASAEAAYKSAVTINPYDSHAHFGLARIAQANGRRTEALKEYGRGFETDPNNQEAQSAVQLLKASDERKPR